MPERIEGYLQTAAEQVRWKRARPLLTAELRTHLLDQRDAYLSGGMEADAAEEEALRQMGDPVALGAELDRVHRPKPQWGLLALTALLALAGGILRVWTAGLVHEEVHIAYRTACALFLGSACFLGGYFLDVSFLGRHGKAVYLAALLGGVLCLRWSPIINHASYFTRYAVLLYPVAYAAWAYAWRGKGWKGLLAAAAGCLPLAAVCMQAPSVIGLFLLLAAGLAAMLTAVRADWFGVGRRSGTLAVGGAALAAVCWAGWMAARGYGRARLLLLFHPELDPLGGGYQAMTVRAAVSGARWLGEGSMGAYAGDAYERVVPAWDTDFLLTTVLHKLGWLPFLALLAVCALLFIWLLVRCLGQKNQLGRLISLSVVLPLGLQAAGSLLLNLGFVLTSAHFPLLVGNYHAVVDMALLGLALSAFRQEDLPGERKTRNVPADRRPLISWRDGDLVIALGRKG